jgi:hypothetical protein
MLSVWSELLAVPEELEEVEIPFKDQKVPEYYEDFLYAIEMEKQQYGNQNPYI